MAEQDHIKLFNIITNDTNKLEVKHVVEVFAGLFLRYFEVTKTGKAIKAKLTEDEYISYVTGFMNSFLSSLYATASKNEKELEKRMDLIQKLNGDVLVSKEEFEKYGNSL